MLPPRTATILNSIVHQYIAKATPVPSQSLVNEYKLAVSPATIRNEMAHLEQGGYITRPHPSSGGIPSDKGYRFYVESLRDVRLPSSEQFLINHLFYQVEKAIEKWLSLTTTIIAQLAQNVAIVTIPKPLECRFKHLQLIVLQNLLALLVLVIHGARVKQKLMTFDQAVSQSQLTAIANKLNTAYSGLNSSQILAKEIEHPLEQQITDSLVKLMQTEEQPDYEDTYIEGWHFMLNQPEFVHSHQMLDLMELVEHRKLLETIAPHQPPTPGMQVIIGKENKAKIIQNYSVVICQYGSPSEVIGTISVVGPTRMPYAHTIATVNYLSSVLSLLVAELYKK